MKKPIRCPAVDDIEPALVFKIRRESKIRGQSGLNLKNGKRNDEIILVLGKVRIRPREERIEDMNVKGRSFWVEVPTFHLKGEPQSLKHSNHP